MATTIITTARQRRGAINTEYVLLLVMLAVAVALGVSVLSAVLSAKAIEIADAIDGGGSAAPLGNVVVEGKTVRWDGGTPPFRVMRSDQPDMSDPTVVGDTADNYLGVEPPYGDNYYVVIDDGGVMSSPVSLSQDALLLAFTNSPSPNWSQVCISDGVSWLNNETPAVQRPVMSYSMANASVASSTTAYVVGARWADTADGGLSWTMHNLPFNPAASLTEVCAKPDGSIWLAGQMGYVYRSTDSGATWGNKSLPGSPLGTLGVMSLASLDGQTAWVAGSGGAIRKTTDGGTSWVSQVSPTTNVMYDAAALNSQVVWAAGAGGTIIRTTDGGATWVTQPSGTAATLYDVNVVDAQTAWVVGSGGVIRKTTDGGATWVAQTSDVATNLMSVAAVDADNAWAVGSSGVVLTTTDGGTSWTRMDAYKGVGIFGRVTANYVAITAILP